MTTWWHEPIMSCSCCTCLTWLLVLGSISSALLLTDLLSWFHDNKQIFIDLDVWEHFNIPKLHFLTHYVDFIKLHGTTDNYSTKYTEHLHIDLAKDAFHSTNKKDEYLQMTTWLEHREKLWHHAIYIQWRLDGKPHISQQSEEVIPPCLSLTKNSSCQVVSLPKVLEDYGATEFSDTFSWYWVKLTWPGLSGWEATNAVNDYYLPFQKVSVFHKVKFYNIDIKGYPGCVGPWDSIHVWPSHRDTWGHHIPGRFDTVLVISDVIPKEGDIWGKKTTVSLISCLTFVNCQIIV